MEAESQESITVKPTKFEVGKFYRCRNGNKAKIMHINHNNHLNYIWALHREGKEDEGIYSHDKDGFFCTNTKHNLDLIEEWKE